MELLASPILVFGVGFAVVGVCLLALIILDRRRFWNIAPPAAHEPRHDRSESESAAPVSRSQRIRYDRRRIRPSSDWDPSQP